MQVRIEEVSPIEKKLVVEVPWTTVQGKLDSAYRELSRSVSLRGFRKGKVPLSVLQRMYGKAVKAEVVTQLVRESFMTAVSEHTLQAVSEPRVEGEMAIEKGKPFSFEAIVQVKGDVEVKDLDNIKLERRPYEVPDAELEHALEQLQMSHTEYLPIEGRDTTARTDVLVLEVSGTIGDEPFKRPMIHVDLSDPERQLLPGLAEALTGVPLDVKDHPVELTIPDDYRVADWAGKTAKLSVSITDARKKEVPELDDEFAKDLDRGETLDELRQSVRDELAEQRRSAIAEELRDALLKELVQRNPIPVAPALVERSMEYQMERMRSMLGIRGNEASVLDDELRERLHDKALESIRGELLLEALLEKEQVEVTEEDMQAEIETMAKQRNMGVARLRAEIENSGQAENLRYQVKRDKLLDRLVERAEVVEVEPREHDHDHDHDHGHEHGHDHGHGHDHDHD